jgi:hypothetical protein
LEIDEYRVRTGTPTAEVEWAYVAPNYFETLKLPLLHGRTFTEGDAAGTSRIAVVSEAMARRYWGKSDVVACIAYRKEMPK